MADTLDLLSFGEFMVEFSTATQKTSLGGDSLNALTAAGFLGLKCGLHTSVACDEHFSSIQATLKNLPVKIFSHEASGKNGKYIISVDPAGERSFEYDRKGSAASHLPEIFVDPKLNTRCLFLSGIAQALTPKWTSYVEKLLLLAKQEKSLTAFDINFRPKLWDQNSAILALKNILSTVDLLFLSDDDLPILEGALNSTDISEAFVHGVKVLIFRQGSKGASYLTPSMKELKSFSPPSVNVVDTSGCGDVFSGSFLASYLKDKNLDTASELAVKLASKHAEFSGALPKSELFKERS